MIAYEHLIDAPGIRQRDDVLAAQLRLDKRTREGWTVISATPMAVAGGSAVLVCVYQRELKATPVKEAGK